MDARPKALVMFWATAGIAAIIPTDSTMMVRKEVMRLISSTESGSIASPII